MSARVCACQVCDARVLTLVRHARRLFGPFRQMWTLPFEAYLQELKHLCEASNYKTVPFTVARKWALGRALRRKLGKGDALSHLSLNVAYSSDFLIGATLQAAVSHSALLRALSTTTDHANVTEARSLGFLSRDGVEVRCGSWLLFACHGSKVLARVSEMAEVVLPSGPCVRLWCTDRRSSGIVEGVDGMIRIWKRDAATSACELLVRLETVSMVALLCCDRGPHLEFRYVL